MVNDTFRWANLDSKERNDLIEKKKGEIGVDFVKVVFLPIKRQK